MSRIIGIGETILDIIFRDNKPQTATPGGSTFNAMISLGRVFKNENINHNETTKVTMVTQTGSDHIGDIIVNFMNDNGVSSELVTRRANTQSHIALAFLNQNNDAQYEFYKDHAHAALDSSSCKELLAENGFSPDDIVVFGSFFAINPVIRGYTQALLMAAQEAGAILYYDINFRPSHIKDLPDTLQFILENCRMATYVRGSSEDFNYMLGTQKPEEILAALDPERHLKGLIITDGSAPINVITQEEESLMFEVPQVKTVSTIGAGDNFNAGFVYYLSKYGTGNNIEWWSGALTTATKFSSAVCQSYENYVPTDFSL